MKHYPDWARGYKERVEAAVAHAGYHSMTDFLRASQDLTYQELADILGDNVAPMQVVEVEFDEAEQGGFMRDAAQDALLRRFRECFNEGWGLDSDFTHARTAGSWISSMQFRAPQRKVWSRKFDAVWDALTALNPPQGWIPKSLEDPFLVKAFDIGWPEGVDESEKK